MGGRQERREKTDDKRVARVEKQKRGGTGRTPTGRDLEKFRERKKESE